MDPDANEFESLGKNPLRRGLAPLGCAVVGLLLLAVAVFAQAQARAHGTVKDESGKALSGVKITVTDPTNSSFNLHVTTDSKGEYSLLLVDATKVYTYTLEKDGYQTAKEQVKIPILSNTEKNFTLLSDAAARKKFEQTGGGSPAIAAYNEGVEKAKAGDLEGAEAKFKEALKHDSKLEPAYRGLAAISFNQKKYQDAADYAAKAIALDPQDTDALNTRYESFKALGDKDKAAKAYDDLKAVSPQLAAGANFNKAANLYNSGKVQEAKKILEQVVVDAPSNAKAHYLLGLCYVNDNYKDKAKQELEKFISLAPNDPDVATAKEMIKYLS